VLRTDDSTPAATPATNVTHAIDPPDTSMALQEP
jgi:hypothetical protein